MDQPHVSKGHGGESPGEIPRARRGTTVIRAREAKRLHEAPRLLVVTNRLPFRMRRGASGWRTERSPGGLATALRPLLRRGSGLWIGTGGDGIARDDAEGRALLARLERRERSRVVELPDEVATPYYEGYANRTLWPLFHGYPSRVEFDPSGWVAYLEANRRFRDAVLEQVREGDLIWVHDYHLMVLPQLLREALPDARIGFFLHIPFPSSDVFRVLPRREELLRGLLGATFIGFQTHEHLEHFRASVLRLLGIPGRIDRVRTDGRDVRLQALPIGIAPDEFAGRLHRSDGATRHLRDLRERFAGRRVLLAVDRLDYTKGIPQRLRAFRQLLAERPDLRGQVVLIQVAVPSREMIPDYEELAQQVNRLVGEINGEWGTAGWVPVIYLRRAIPRAELVALYALADVCWVTPLRDGMNLVAKEYVACREGRDGVLVLSEFAGAAEDLGEALIVNPYDEERMAAAVERALSMSPDERHERMAALHRRVVRNDVFGWGERFLSELVGTQAADEVEAGRPPILPLGEATAAFANAPQRILLLDYDGTLVPIARRPSEASPPASTVALLARLASDLRNRVAVVSGRPADELEAWFGGVDRLWLFAEHGAVARLPRRSSWDPLVPPPATDWRPLVRPILERVVDRTPGSFLEEKAYSLVWHYRMANAELGEWQANELVAVLAGMLADTEAIAVRGKRLVEVRPVTANKGTAIARMLHGRPAGGFVLAAGDDETDEELFERLRNETPWTVLVGDGISAAHYRLSAPTSLVAFLDGLAGADR